MTDKPRKRRISDIYQFSTSKFFIKKFLSPFFAKIVSFCRKTLAFLDIATFSEENKKAF
jgi:hypothetical protein